MQVFGTAHVCNIHEAQALQTFEIKYITEGVMLSRERVVLRFGEAY